MYLTCCRLCDSEWSQMFVEKSVFYKHTTRLRVAPLIIIYRNIWQEDDNQYIEINIE